MAKAKSKKKERPGDGLPPASPAEQQQREHAAPYLTSEDAAGDDPGAEGVYGTRSPASPLDRRMIDWAHQPGAGISAQWREYGVGSAYLSEARADAMYEPHLGVQVQWAALGVWPGHDCPDAEQQS